MAVEPARRLFTIDEYYRMAEAGILQPDDRVELIGGEIVEMTPIGPRHAGCVDRLARFFILALDDRAVVRIQLPIVLDDRTEPQPDVVLARPRPGAYSRAHPRPDDVLLVIEIAETSLSTDRNQKLARYAGAQLPESWIVDLRAGRLEVYRQPVADGYASRTEYGREESVIPLAFPDLEVPTTEVLGD